MQVDCITLGVIKYISKFYINVCLPFGEVGRINISEINDKYTELLSEIVESGVGNVCGHFCVFFVGFREKFK